LEWRSQSCKHVVETPDQAPVATKLNVLTVLYFSVTRTWRILQLNPAPVAHAAAINVLFHNVQGSKVVPDAYQGLNQVTSNVTPVQKFSLAAHQTLVVQTVFVSNRPAPLVKKNVAKALY
jgi:hypothetical protein